MPDISAFPRDAGRGDHDVTARGTYKTRDVFIRARAAGLGWGVHDVQGYAATMPPRPTIEVGGGSTVEVAGSSAFSFTLSGLVRGPARLTLPTTLTFTPAGAVTGLAQVGASSAVSFTPAGQVGGKAAVAGTSGVAFTPGASVGLAVSISGASAFSFATSMVPSGAARVQGATSASFAGSMAVTATASVLGAAALTFQLYATLTDDGVEVIHSHMFGSSARSLRVYELRPRLLLRGSAVAGLTITDERRAVVRFGASARTVQWSGTPES